MSRPRLLDLFCGAGGASMGYYRAGFDVVGVDINPQPRYPFEFHQADALTFPLEGFDVIHASPPCQAYTKAQKLRGNEHPELIWPIRKRIKQTGKLYVIENVPSSPLINPIVLCGAYFGLKTYRHRLFESNAPLIQPPHPEHQWKTTKMGRRPKNGEFMHVVGHFSGIDEARTAMGIDWMKQRELAESIPPAYTEYIGKQVIAALQLAA